MYYVSYDAKGHRAAKNRIAARKRQEAAKLEMMMDAKIAAGRGYLTDDEDSSKKDHLLKVFDGLTPAKRAAVQRAAKVNKGECLDETWDKICDLLDEAEKLEKPDND